VPRCSARWRREMRRVRGGGVITGAARSSVDPADGSPALPGADTAPTGPRGPSGVETRRSIPGNATDNRGTLTGTVDVHHGPCAEPDASRSRMWRRGRIRAHGRRLAPMSPPACERGHEPAAHAEQIGPAAQDSSIVASVGRATF
jgi:hypothetical protein